MPDQVTLDVIDRPAAGLRAIVRRARAVRAARPQGLRALIVLGTADLVARLRPAPTLRRIALLAAWEDGTDVDGAWSAALGGLGAGARESWHVEAEVARAAFSAPWKGWTPDVSGARALDPAEPVLVMISGDLYGRHVRPSCATSPGPPARRSRTRATSAASASTARR
jgi:hypothetical protein